MSIAGKIGEIRAQVPPYVRIIAVSKTRTIEEILEAYYGGQRLFGENKAQELIAKHPLLPADIEWHFIGHLQTNKVKLIVPFISMIESVDSLKLIRAVNHEARNSNRIIECLLQFHIASEETKFGLDLEEALSLIDTVSREKMENVAIRGVMGMATFTDDSEVVCREFRYLKSCFDRLKEDFFSKDEKFSEISMGMSGDYLPAIKEGSTMIRLGTVIFGNRQY